jgi:hypothetical protein
VNHPALILLIGPALVLGGCRCSGASEGPGAAATGSAPLARPPVDRLAAGELAEGPHTAFGFTFPNKMRIERRFLDSVHASGRIAPESVANYVRQRVGTTHVEVGAARTVFPRVQIKGGAPDKVYRIEVVADGSTTRLVLSDVTPPPVEPGLSEEERWRRAGMSPEGKPIDPQKME